MQTTTETTCYGTATAAAWDRLHPRLAHRGAWAGHPGPLPVLDGTVVRLTVDRLPGDRKPTPVCLWWSATGAAPADVDRLWQAYIVAKPRSSGPTQIKHRGGSTVHGGPPR